MATDDVEAAARAWYEATEADNPTTTRWDDEWPAGTLWLKDEYRARARRFLAAMPSRSDDGWRTIDSAPKDGTEVLVCRPDGDEWEMRVAYWTGRRWWLEVYDNGLERSSIYEPTHWRPLPPPPNDGDEHG